MQTVQQVVSNAKDAMAKAMNPLSGGTPTPSPNDHEAVRTTITSASGCPLGFGQAKYSLTAGPLGPALFTNDYALMEKSMHFVREKIPARNVHALGYGAHGTFTVTNDISNICKAKIFSQVGKKTEISTRLSGTFIEQGDPDVERDVRGFALKFYTEEGNWDLLCVNLPVFIGRDAKAGPDSVHAWKRDPRTGFYNPSQLWDYTNQYPESLHGTLMIFSDTVGTPLSFRTMNAWAANTFSFYNDKQERVWVRFHIVAELGQKGMTDEESKLIAGQDGTFLGRDLREAIDRGDFPRYKLGVQVMKEDDGYKIPFAFDCTKVWKHDQFPVIEIGIIELNKNPIDYFTEVEQIAFSPARVVPGIGYSPDRLLQGRLHWYDDTQFHRVGSNFKQLPINRPRNAPARNIYNGGFMHIDVQDRFPHYWPNSYNGPQPDPSLREPPFRIDGAADYYPYPGEGTDADYYQPCREFLSVLEPEQFQNLCKNLANSLYRVDDIVYPQVLKHFTAINANLATLVDQIVQSKKNGSAVKTPGEATLERLKQMAAKMPKKKNF
eukprot:TRINITY_DN4831_c0_g1_i2.p1 TRINITY_DN4831_c0_g1~~TRINITY_DN4831_c0_g1_i2.p1  ORF type:complete len:550 (+),score=179.76 TRINITY_DN4831_c0_g1_i2:80-1729(+)